MIREVTVRGFRGVPEELRLFFAPLTLLAGRNGLGKTTVFDAIDWCLFGDAWRLGGDGAALRNLYRDEARPYVTVLLDLGDRVCRVERTEAGAKLDGSTVSDRDLILGLVSDVDMFPPYSRDLAERVRRLVYLPQETIRELLSPESNRAREGLFSVLLGVPNAALVRSSFRRIKERLDERHEASEVQLATYANDVGELRREVGVERARMAADRAEVIAETRRVLGSDASDLMSPDALLERARTTLETVDRERRRLEEVVLFAARFEARRALLTEERERRGGEVGALRHELGELERAVEEAARASQAARQRAGAAAVTLREAEATRIASALRLRLTRDVAAIDAAMVETGARLLALEEAVGAARNAVDRLVGQVSRQRGAVDRQRRVVEALRREHEAALSMESLSEQRRLWAARVASLNEELAAAHAAVTRQEGDLTEARLILARSEQEQAALLQRMSSFERMRALRTELISLAEHLELSTCPLCGATYQDSREFLAHCRDVEKLGRPDSDQPEEPHEAIVRRNVEEIEDHLRIRRNDLVRVEGEQRSAASQLATIDERIGRETTGLTRNAEGVARALREAEDVLANLSRSSEEAEAGFRAAADDMAARRRSTDSARAEFEELQARRRALQDELGAERSVDPATEEARLQEAERRRAEALREHQALEEQSRVAFAEERGRRSDRDRAALMLSDAQGQLAAAEQALETAISEMRTKLDDVGLAAVEPSSAHDALESKMRQYVETERLVNSLTELVAMERQRELSRELDALEAKMKEATDDLAVLDRASERVRAIETAVESRLESEEATGMDRLRDGIQECLRAIYPHRHLDVVELSASEKKILVSDDNVGRGVEPAVFTSTGQQNALVLAVFIAAALRQRVTTLPFILLDEPVQNLDDVHFLGFLGLIKRIVLSRQLILSTADKNVAEVMRRQMKGLIDQRKYAHYEWREFRSRSGPEVISVEQPSSSRD